MSARWASNHENPLAPLGIPLVMEVNPSVPAKTVPEFIAYAKANPGKINMASSGIGIPLHVAGELFKMMAGVDMIHVPSWCANYGTGHGGGINCSYTSFEQCRATVSGIYGFCTPNPYPGTGYGRGGTWNLTPTSRGRSYRAER
jgi:hypothetical protein